VCGRVSWRSGAQSETATLGKPSRCEVKGGSCKSQIDTPAPQDGRGCSFCRGRQRSPASDALCAMMHRPITRTRDTRELFRNDLSQALPHRAFACFASHTRRVRARAHHAHAGRWRAVQMRGVTGDVSAPYVASSLRSHCETTAAAEPPVQSRPRPHCKARLWGR
jgi:hypothetical protein